MKLIVSLMALGFLMSSALLPVAMADSDKHKYEKHDSKSKDSKSRDSKSRDSRSNNASDRGVEMR
ncbi:MAG: hypothetical protein Q9M20_04430, partial [Mariprofundaceae bacterium]|nr:hypothetical protein [Mariprofundaceae bacterium]